MNIDAFTQREIDKVMRKAETEIAKAQRHIERETRRAEEHARRAHERATRAARRAREQIARKSRKWGISMDAGPTMFGPTSRAARAGRQGPSAEEQISILKMLQEGKISVEEAELLLSALEG